MAIHGYDGVPGSGKTSAAVHRQWLARLRRIPTWGNIPLYDLRLNEWTGRPYNPLTFGWPWSGYIANMGDLLDIRRGDILLDEVDMWFPATEWQRIGFEQRRFWTQHRKAGLNIIWTCTFVDRVLNVVRDITELLYRCARLPFVPNRSFQKAINPTQTRDTRKSSMWFMVKLHRQLWQLYHSNYIVGNGLEGEKARASELGAAALGVDIEVRVGSLDDIWQFAGECRVIRPARKDERQEVAPLLTPGVIRELLVRMEEVKRGSGNGFDRVAARRLSPVLSGIVGVDV